MISGHGDRLKHETIRAPAESDWGDIGEMGDVGGGAKRDEVVAAQTLREEAGFVDVSDVVPIPALVATGGAAAHALAGSL